MFMMFGVQHRVCASKHFRMHGLDHCSLGDKGRVDQKQTQQHCIHVLSRLLLITLCIAFV